MKKVHFFMMLVIGMSSLAVGARAEQPVWMEKPTVIKLIEEARNSTKQVPLELT